MAWRRTPAWPVVTSVFAALGACADDGAPAKAGPDAGGGAALLDGGSADGGASPGPDGGGPPIDTSPPPVCPTTNTGPGPLPDGTVPGALSVPFPTIRNATVEWAITGDANENGVVAIRFRKPRDAGWRRAMPLRRVPAGSNVGFSWSNRHSGSLFDLEPATTYEVEAYLLDPDGGCEVRNTTFTTRAVPGPMAGAPIKAATPGTLATILGGVEPGDIVELGGGAYAGFQLQRDGAAGRPIVLRAAAGANVTINGDVSFISRKYVQLSGVTVNGRVRLNLTTEASVTRCTITTTSDGIVAGLRSENAYIADNVVTGATAWNEAALGVDGNNVGEGILVTGPGHVIEHNRVSGFRDAISLLEDSEAVDQFSIDVIENDVANAADDGVEADFCFHNCRIVRNRFTNTFIAMSSQPGLGGPTYFVRNAAFNVILSAFKLQRASVGDVLLHNTVVKNGDAFGIYTTDTFSRQYTRNNLFVGGPGGTYNGYASGTGKVLALAAAAPSGDYDYDGFGSTTGTFTGVIGGSSFGTLAELRARTTEKHAVELGLSAFAAAITYPTSPFPARPAADLRVAATGAPIDVGVVVPNVSDAFRGTAPDLGAYEAGDPLPHYGPR